MKKLVLASASAIALLGLAACSDTDQTTTQSTPAPVEDPAGPVTPAPDAAPEAPATDGTTTQSIEPAPDAGMQPNETAPAPVEPAPAE